jgi:RimJ/RimL family protein N-acetyltransferase
MRVRPAVQSDATAFGLVHVRSWQAAYRGLMPQSYLDALDPEQRASVWQRWLSALEAPRATFALEHPVDGVVGFVGVAASRDPDADPALVGEVASIYLQPSHWGLGGGRLLMDEAVRSLAQAGFRRATLWVLETNERARRFYAAAGWRPDGDRKIDESFGIPLAEVRYARDLPDIRRA